MNKKYTDINSNVIDKWVDEGWEWGQPISHEVFEKAKNNDWFVLLTPTKPVPKDWFCDFKNAEILGLASGGGQQMPIFTALGAKCTVLDYSEKQLLKEKDLSTHNERYIYRGERSITEEGLKNSSAKLMPKGTVLFSSRAPIGYVAIAGKELCTNQGFKSLIPKNGVADSEFIYYLFKHKKSDIEAIASGTTNHT